jgi:hypothetical protein
MQASFFREGEAMDRRSVVAGLVGSAVVAVEGLSGGAAANPAKTDRESRGLAPYGRAWVSANGRQIYLTVVIIATNTAETPGIDLRLDLPQFNENRSNLPILGGLARPTVEDRLAASRPVGRLVMAGSALILIPSGQGFRPPGRSVLVGDDISWDINKPFRPVSVTGLPLFQDLIGRRPVGAAFESKKSLLLVVRPSIIGQLDG